MSGIMPYQKAHMFRFTIFGIPVAVQPFFWITLAIIGGAGRASDAVALFGIVLFVLAGFISILVHELGHALTARRFGAYSEITLHAFGGLAAYSGVRLTRLQSFLVTAAGPAIQLLLGLAVWYMIPPLSPRLSDQAYFFLRDLMVISIYWAVLNLLPVYPLDGGQMLHAALGPQRIRTTLWVTIIVAVAVGLYMLERKYGFVFPLLLGIFAWQAYQKLQETRWRR